MKNFIKKIIVFKLNLLAKLYLWRFKPQIIAVTGNVGKTSTKEAIACVLGKVKKVRYGRGSLNNELGVPLAVLGDWWDDYYSTNSSILFWLKVIIVSSWSLIVSKTFPEILILEFGAQKPGDIGRLVKKYKPKIGIVTAVGEIPVHVEYFSDPDNLAREKSKLISSLKSTDSAILNHDDPAVFDMKDKTRAKVMTYGFTDGSEVKLSNFDFRLDEQNKPVGVGFKIHHGPNSSFVPVSLHGVLGKSQALAAGAAASVGILFGMNLIEISQAMSDYQGPKGRLRILRGIKNTTIIDDTYNAAPLSTRLALDTLKSLPGLRRVAIIGDMLELGKFTVRAHQEIGNLAAEEADLLITVGPRAKFIADAAENQLKKENIYSFVTSDLAKTKVQELIKEGDLILVKGSQGVRMEKIVEEIMAEPERAKDLLVRQSRSWKGR